LFQGANRSGFLSTSSFQSPTEDERTGTLVVTSRWRVVERQGRVHPEQRMMRLVSGAGMPDRPLLEGVTDLQRETGRNVVM